MHACGAKRASDRDGLRTRRRFYVERSLANSSATSLRRVQTHSAEEASAKKLRVIFTRAAKAEAIELRQNSKDSRGKSGPPLRFRKCADDERPGFRDLIEVREQLDLIVIG